MDGTLNLHNSLPDLNFFVMLSSLTGVAGNTSQANHAAGNTFQDALARHCTAKGQPAVSLDLGAVEDVGFVAESSDEVRDVIEKKPMQLANGPSASGSAAGQGLDKNSLSDLFVSQVSDQEASSRITTALVSKLSDLFNIGASDIDGTMPMSRYGVDSLIDCSRAEELAQGRCSC